MVSNNFKKYCINMVGHSVIKRLLEQLNIQINTIEKTVKKERLKKNNYMCTIITCVISL